MNWRNREFLDLCYLFPCYLRLDCCDGGMGEPVHSNQPKHGKGGAMKAHDCYVIPGCRSCHREFDQGRTMDRDEKRELWDRLFLEFLPLALEQAFGTSKRRRA